MICRIRAVVYALFALSAVGCAGGVGQQAIQGGRESLNNIIESTSQQQLFSNLIRMHDRRMPLFMDITEVDDSLSLQGQLSGGPAGLFGPAVHVPSTVGGAGMGVTASVMGSVTYTDAPVIRYVPVSGSALVSQLATPITIDSIQQLVDSGWNLRSVLDMATDRLTPKGEDRDQVLNDIQYLCDNQCLTVSAIKWPPPGALKPTSPAETFTESYGPIQNGQGDATVSWSFGVGRKTGGLTAPLPAKQSGSVKFSPIKVTREKDKEKGNGTTTQSSPSESIQSLPFPLSGLPGGASSTSGASAAASPGAGAPQAGVGGSGNDTLVIYYTDHPGCASYWVDLVARYEVPGKPLYFSDAPADNPGAAKFLRLPVVPTGDDETDKPIRLGTFTDLVPPPLHLRSAMGVLISSARSGDWAAYIENPKGSLGESSDPLAAVAPNGVPPCNQGSDKHRCEIRIFTSEQDPGREFLKGQDDSGGWYFIRMDDPTSQQNFMLLSLLMTIQSGPPSVSPLTPTFSVGLGH